jgi:uncharacterized OsmC-like protein
MDLVLKLSFSAKIIQVIGTISAKEYCLVINALKKAMPTRINFFLNVKISERKMKKSCIGSKTIN